MKTDNAIVHPTPELVARYPLQGCAIFLVRPGEPRTLYMSRRLNTPTFSGRWQCPGGKIETGEDPLRAAMRELEEETDLYIPEPERWTFLGCDVRNLDVWVNTQEYLGWAYMIELPTDYPRNSEPKKSTSYIRFTMEEAFAQDLMPGMVCYFDKVFRLQPPPGTDYPADAAALEAALRTLRDVDIADGY